jgi:hypothetical protein
MYTSLDEINGRAIAVHPGDENWRSITANPDAVFIGDFKPRQRSAFEIYKIASVRIAGKNIEPCPFGIDEAQLRKAGFIK